jgi:hypothetical protein
MQTLQIDASPAQMKRLHKGRRVRVKKGTGFELLVHPTTYNMVSRTFNKGKGSEIQLSPEEIAMNQGIRKAISPEAHNPSLQPKVGAGIGDDIRRSLSHVKLGDALNEHLGTNYGYMARAGLDNAIQSAKSAAMSKRGIDSRYASAPYADISGTIAPHSRMVGGQLERGSVGRNGGMMSSYTPPALVSQPFSANFQFQHFLPPQYQHFNTGGHDLSGNGLYL